MLKRTAVLAAALLLAVSAVALAQDEAPKPEGPLTRVEPIKVCMINEHNMGKDQIPVEIDGKTYYGCCAMCKKTLAEKPETRVATDPVTGKQVDKAVAVIGAQEDGRVFYFENEQSLAKHNAKYEKKK
jgi:YHS domain-containing protein